MIRRFFFLFFLPSVVLSQTVIYRSVQINKTSALATGSGNNLTISGTTATFANPLPDSIGVGDCIQYDDDNDGDIDANDSVCFIHGRTSSTVFTVANAAGGTPTATAAADQDWAIFRSYINFNLNEAGTENTGIDVDVSNFDAGSRNIVTANEQWHFACYRGQMGGGMDFDTWTTGTRTSNTNNYVRYYAPYLTSEVGVTQRHTGKYVNDNVAACVAGAAAASITFGNGSTRVIIEGLIIKVQTTGAQIGLLFDGTTATSMQEIKDCIIFGQSAGTGVYGINYFWNAGGVDVIKISNTVFYDLLGSFGAGCNMGAASDTMYVYNCTFSDMTNYCLNISSGFVVGKNIISQNGGVGAFSVSPLTRPENNASDDASAQGTNSRINQTFTFTNEAGNDFSLTTEDVGARNFGKDVSADAFLAVTTDNKNASRPSGGAFDIGAFETIETSEVETSEVRRWIVQSLFPEMNLIYIALGIAALVLVYRKFFRKA